MEEKFKAYRNYQWTSDEKWQSYMRNIYPVPPATKFEKMRRRWYQRNVDAAFDIEFEPDTSNSSSSNQGAGPGA
jgi:hypothetical protein